MLLFAHDLALIHLKGFLDLAGHVRIPLHHLPLPPLYRKYVVVVDTIVLLRSLLLQLLFDKLNGVRVLPVVVRGVCARLRIMVLLSAWGLQWCCFSSAKELRE